MAAAGGDLDAAGLEAPAPDADWVAGFHLDGNGSSTYANRWNNGLNQVWH
ncbi:hypothetical protein [Streptomyces sp. NPDC097981]